MALPRHGLNVTGHNILDLVNAWREGGVDLDAPYQRGDVWTHAQRVNLIRSLLMGIPIAALILNDRDRVYVVIDGKQRLTTMIKWFDDKLAVPADWFEANWVAETGHTGEVTYDDLSDAGRRFCARQFTVPVAEARLATVAEEAEVYELVNSAGTAQTAEDLARAAEFARRGR